MARKTLAAVALLTVIAVAGLMPLQAQSSGLSKPPAGAASLPAAQALTNADIIQLVKLGIPLDAIVTKIKSSKSSFDTSSAAVAVLRQNAVPEAVIIEMALAAKNIATNPVADAPALADDGLNREDSMNLILTKMSDAAKINYVLDQINNATGATDVFPVEQDLTKIEAQPGLCRFSYHSKVTFNGSVAEERDEGVSLKDVENMALLTKEQVVMETASQPAYSFKIDPSVFDLVMMGAKNVVISSLSFYDVDVANRVAKTMVHAVELCGGASKYEDGRTMKVQVGDTAPSVGTPDTTVASIAPAAASYGDVHTDPALQDKLDKLDEDDQRRQNKIDTDQRDLKSEEEQLDTIKGDIQQLQDQEAAVAGQQGGALAATIAEIGIAKLESNERDEEKQIKDTQDELDSLGDEADDAQRQRRTLTDAVANATNQPSQTSNNQGTGGSGSYTGPNADWVHRLLARVGSWSCPSGMTAQDGTPPQVQGDTTSLRGQYVKAAVLQAWGAECYGRQERDNEAAQQAAAMMKSLQDAQALCGEGAASVSGGGTVNIYRCGELEGGPGSDGSTGTLTGYAYYQLDGIRVGNNGLVVTVFTAPQPFTYPQGAAQLAGYTAPVEVCKQAGVGIENYFRGLGSSRDVPGDCFLESEHIVAGSRPMADNEITSAMSSVYSKYAGLRNPYDTERIVIIEPGSGNVIRQLQVDALPKPPPAGGAGRAN